MKMIVEATTTEEIALLGLAIANVLGCEVSDKPAEVVAPQEETVVPAVVETEKKGRGRPKKTVVAESPVASTEATVTPAVDTTVDFETFKKAVVVKADESAEVRDKVVEILTKFTGGKSSKTADVPEDLRQTVLDEIAEL